MPLEFRYFRAPESEMLNLLPGGRVCSLCGLLGRCFTLEEEGQIGCYGCLRGDRFGFDHTTDAGYIMEDGFVPNDEPSDEPKRVFVVANDGEAVADSLPLVYPPQVQVSEEAIAELRRTPNFSTWQDVSWPVHCDDFMAYRGIWGPKDFDKAAGTGSRRDLFIEMMDSDFHTLWPEDGKPRFGENIVVFECLHCSARTGIYDLD